MSSLIYIGNIEIIKLLLENNIDINATNKHNQDSFFLVITYDYTRGR